MADWLVSLLTPFGLDQPEILDYLIPILLDEDETIDDRVQACKEFLEASVSEETDFTDFEEALRTKLEKGNTADDLTQKQASEFEKQREREVLEAQKAEAELAKLQLESESAPKRVLTKEERLDRKRNLQIAEQYGGQMKLDQNGDFVYVGVDADEDEPQSVNVNVERVKQQQAAVREESKKKHQANLQHEKELLEKDRLRKEKAKRKTQKKEKRRA